MTGLGGADQRRGDRLHRFELLFADPEGARGGAPIASVVIDEEYARHALLLRSRSRGGRQWRVVGGADPISRATIARRSLGGTGLAR